MIFTNGVNSSFDANIHVTTMEIPDKNWEVVNMNFIFGLTPSTHGYDAIVVCVDKFSKMEKLGKNLAMSTTFHP